MQLPLYLYCAALLLKDKAINNTNGSWGVGFMGKTEDGEFQLQLKLYGIFLKPFSFKFSKRTVRIEVKSVVQLTVQHQW